MDLNSYALAKSYVDKTVAGGGSLKGKNCTIQSITPITGGNRVTFQWTLDNGIVQTDTMDVMDGENGTDGVGIASAVITNNHLIISYTDGTTEDAGIITILNDNTSSNTTTYSSQKIESMFAELISRIVWVGTHDQWAALSAADKAKYLNVYFTDDAGEDLPIAEEQDV